MNTIKIVYISNIILGVCLIGTVGVLTASAQQADGAVDSQVRLQMELPDNDIDATVNGDVSGGINVGSEGFAVDAALEATTSANVAADSTTSEADPMNELMLPEAEPRPAPESAMVTLDGVAGIRVQAEWCDDRDQDCDGVTGTPRPALSSEAKTVIKVNGTMARSAAPTAKQLVRTEAAVSINSMNKAAAEMASAVMVDESIESVTSTKTETRVTFTKRVRLFGFIPMSMQATAVAKAGGEVVADLPWYSIITAGDSASVYTSLAATLRAEHDAALAVR
jgi:hypothetical protein